MRVLIAAENASARMGGEAILPYHYFRLLRARGVDAHLIVHARVRDELVEVFAGELARLHFVEDLWLQKVLFKLGRVLPRRVDEATLGLVNQMLTQWGQRGVVRGLAVAGVTVVHQPIPVSPRTPSLLAVDGVPLVVGPLNGGMEYPEAFRGNESVGSRVAIAVARGFTDLGNALFAGKRKAAVVLVANERTRRALPAGLRGVVAVVAENGVDLGAWGAGGTSDGSRFVFVGRLVDWKALDVVLEAMVQVAGARLEVIGDGPMRGAWEAVAARLGVGDRVEFVGWRSQAECAARLAGCCALVLPSVYECGGAVVLEAMAMGRAVIATDWGGPADYLDATCGVLVKPVGREELVRGFAEGMTRLMSSAEVRGDMGEAGRARVVREFGWEGKVDVVMGWYGVALGGGVPLPLV